MIDAEFETISISNFRSIRGTVAIPLQAPAVLVHGPNGAGKSTVMSALELALAGGLSEIASLDSRHLIHRDSGQAEIRLGLRDGHYIDITIDPDGIGGVPLLEEDDARFLGERCYLRQRLLGRLLEFYEGPGKDGETRLTGFVKDLLGLDELEALIDGLDFLRDKRLVKNQVPSFRALEAELKADRPTIGRLAAELRKSKEELSDQRAALGELLASLEIGTPLEGAARDTLTEGMKADEERLIDLVGMSRDLASVSRRSADAGEDTEAPALGRLEDAASKATSAADAWRDQDGTALELALDALRKTLPGLPAAASASDPGEILAQATASVEIEIERLRIGIQEDDVAQVEAARLQEAIAAVEHRLEGFDAQVAESSATDIAESLAGALAAIAPHIHDETCPVCARDYSEIGTEPLSAHLAVRISELGAQAERMQETAKARVSALSERRALEEQLKVAGAGRLEPEALVEARGVLARLEDAARRLAELKPGVVAGAALLRAKVEAERDLTTARERHRSQDDSLRELKHLASVLGSAAPAEQVPIADAVKGLSTELTRRISELEDRLSTRKRVDELIQHTEQIAARHTEEEEELRNRRAWLSGADAAVADLEARRIVLRQVHSTAESARARTVRAVFDDTLNRSWRELFIRLAPEEPFVPAFKLPRGDRGLETRLVTEHRDGGPGGPPSAMLSAGNLNTAALTLFLALNLSAPRRLPWLLLDDPVQSMDEIHVAQFAALLRTLTRTAGRRVILAVHDRALFEYLKLELSPARPGEALTTVELERGTDGVSTAATEYVDYVEDPVFAQSSPA